MTCDEALHCLLGYLDNELGRDERERLEEHLKICRGCFSRLEFERLLKDRLAETKRSKPPPRLEARIRALLRRY